MISRDEFMRRHTPSDAQRREPQQRERERDNQPRDRDAQRRDSGSMGPEQGRGPGMSGPPSIEMIFGRMDRNQDGKVSQDEAPGFIWERLSAADANQDGSVTKEELERHQQKMRGDQPRGDQPRGDQRPEGRGRRPVENRPGENRPQENRPADEKPKTPSA
jgi:hypothetical protein